MLNDDGKEFMEVKEENRLLHKMVKRQSAIIRLLEDTLKRLVPDDLRKQIKNASDAIWVNHPDNSKSPDKRENTPSKKYTNDGYSP